MTVSILRSAEGWWVGKGDSATRIDTDAATTAELIADRAAVEIAVDRPGTVDPADLALLAPVTTPCRVIAQMTNFASHAVDAGMDPATLPLTFFRKSSGSITGPRNDIRKPGHVGFLDYEVEIGLVIGRELPVGTAVTEADLAGCIAGLVVTNDISARDIQLPKTQFYEAKSYPTFTPVGPALVLLAPGELERFTDLRLRLTVNGTERQNALVGGDMIHHPLQALQGLAAFQHLAPGDLVLTGTPVGTALSAPPKEVAHRLAKLPPAQRWPEFFDHEAANPDYLRDGDVVEASVATDDGVIDLGKQRTVVRG